ncbi:MAG: 3-hydroxyacyl-CoA dehydrogenase family protein [Chloroflexota bacterium]
MKIEEVKEIAVLGAGVMGHAIAQVCAEKGYHVNLQDTKEEFVRSGMARIEKFLQGGIERGKITKENADAILTRIKVTTNLPEAIKNADVVIEATPEDMALKKSIFKELTGLTKEATILASNTSTLSITEIASATEKPQRVIGMHFFNPVQLMKPVEIIRGVLTSDETVGLISDLAMKLDKTPLVVRDSPGFASTRLGVALFQEASKMLTEGVASVRDIDMGARLFYGHRMGPFETCDLVGLDARLNNLNSLYQATGDSKWVPPLLLKQLVASGYLGKKPNSKGGYYTYFGFDSI